jgi:hypothetical protein
MQRNAEIGLFVEPSKLRLAGIRTSDPFLGHVHDAVEGAETVRAKVAI